VLSVKPPLKQLVTKLIGKWATEACKLLLSRYSITNCLSGRMMDHTLQVIVKFLTTSEVMLDLKSSQDCAVRDGEGLGGVTSMF